MEERDVYRGGWKGQTQCALCVMSCLLVVIGIMLPHVLSPLRSAQGSHDRFTDIHPGHPQDKESPTDTEDSSSKLSDDSPQHATYTESDTTTTSHTEAELNDEAKNESTAYSESETTASHSEEASHDGSKKKSSSTANSDSSDIPDEDGKIGVVPVNQNWMSVLRGGCGSGGCSWSCGDGGCVWSGSGWVNGLLLTPDRRLVMTNWHSKTVVVVKPPSVNTTVHLPTQPLGLAHVGQSGSRVAVTCGLQEIFLINIDQTEQPVQHVPTKKRYTTVTSGLTDTTLIVSSLVEDVIDVITLDGDVIKTLMDTTRFHVFSLTNAYGDVLVGALNKQSKSSELLRLIQSKSPSSQLHPTESQSSQSGQSYQSQWDAEEYRDEQLTGHMWRTVAHPSGHIFISQDNGVLVRTTDGQYLRVLDQPELLLNPTAMALAGDSLFVVWDHANFADFVVVEYHLHGFPG